MLNPECRFYHKYILFNPGDCFFIHKQRKQSKRKLYAALGMSGSQWRQHQFRRFYLINRLRFPRRIRGSCEPLLMWRVALLVLF